MENNNITHPTNVTANSMFNIVNSTCYSTQDILTVFNSIEQALVEYGCTFNAGPDDGLEPTNFYITDYKNKTAHYRPADHTNITEDKNVRAVVCQKNERKFTYKMALVGPNDLVSNPLESLVITERGYAGDNLTQQMVDRVLSRYMDYYNGSKLIVPNTAKFLAEKTGALEYEIAFSSYWRYTKHVHERALFLIHDSLPYGGIIFDVSNKRSGMKSENVKQAAQMVKAHKDAANLVSKTLRVKRFLRTMHGTVINALKAADTLEAYCGRKGHNHNLPIRELELLQTQIAAWRCFVVTEGVK
jgi:hypothetical protein